MRKIILLMFMLVFIFPVPVFAGELKLVKGKGIPVCEAHFKNLKTMDLYKMVCERDEYYPEENGIKRPQWEKLDLRENKEIVKRIHKFYSYGDQFSEMEIMDDEKQFEELMKVIYLKSHALYKTAVDIDNDGKAEKILLYSQGFCMETHVYSRPLFVLYEAKNLIDVKKTELLLDPFKKYVDVKVKSSPYMLYDVFFYKNISYFDKWDVDYWTLTVYKLSKGSGREACKYKYEKTLKNKED
ncbi:MAG: hypothetical protein HY957_11065 [Nitrospirae bacterium]|nr:hypothetical protein [Nitrospirota bacterium]